MNEETMINDKCMENAFDDIRTDECDGNGDNLPFCVILNNY